MTPPTPRSGILVVDKAPGATSFDVVALVRRRLHVRRVGHAGTLDPNATGVLPILIGEATKLMPYLSEQDKEYEATLRFGLTTDTHDLTGRVLSESPVDRLSREDLERACLPFVGRVPQVPPMYSAIHHAGRRLYELAREGLEVERPPREVTIHAIAVVALAPAGATLRVVCGKGTYIRALAADIGRTLGCGAVVERLVRRRVGPFQLEDTLAQGALDAMDADGIWSRVLPPAAALAGWPQVRLDELSSRAFLNGQAVQAPTLPRGKRLVAVHERGGRFVGVGEIIAGGKLKPARLLHADHPGPRVLPA